MVKHLIARCRHRAIAERLAVITAVLCLACSFWLFGTDGVAALTVDEATELWQSSPHALQEVNCSSCHKVEDTGEFIARPGVESCRNCHEPATETYLLGKHGIRDLEGQSPLKPEMAWLPMQPEAHGLEMSCNTCHDAHEQNTRHASVDACLTCHADNHSLNYIDSKHAGLSEGNSELPRPAGGEVTCATCHLPRTGTSTVQVNHNNTYTLKPRDRMVADVCMNCHGMEFAYRAVFDDELVEANFDRFPTRDLETLDMMHRQQAERELRSRR